MREVAEAAQRGVAAMPTFPQQSLELSGGIKPASGLAGPSLAEVKSEVDRAALVRPSSLA